MTKQATVYGIVSFGGHLVRGVTRVVLTTEEPLTVLENDKLYYGEGVKARVTKTKTMTEDELNEKLEEELVSYKTKVLHMYTLNSSETVKILKKVFDVKTCKKLSFSKDSDDDSEEDNDSTVSEKKTKTKGKDATESVKAKGKSATDETETKEVKAKGKGKSVTEETETKEVKAKGKGKSVTEETETKEVKAKGKGKSVKEEEVVVVKDKKKPDLTESKKMTTTKAKESKIRIPLSDSDDDLGSGSECELDE